MHQLKNLVEPVSWNYFTKFDSGFKSSPAWRIYPKLFTNAWAGSAFKGGLHPFSMITNTTHHVLNNREWLHFMQLPIFKRDFFSAIILTGWSRFNHFMSLCDLLPTAYPSLLYSLQILNTDEFHVNDSIQNCDALLTSIQYDPQICESLPGKISSSCFFFYLSRILFLGASIWSRITSLSTLLSKINDCLKILKSIAPRCNRRHVYVQCHGFHQRLSELKSLHKDLLATKQILVSDLMELYPNYVIDEWFSLYVTPVESKIDTILFQFSLGQNKTS